MVRAALNFKKTFEPFTSQGFPKTSNLAIFTISFGHSLTTSLPSSGALPKIHRLFLLLFFLVKQSTIAPMLSLNGLVFDLEKESTLYIDLAKLNSRSKFSRTDNGRAGSSEKKVRE
ncbi:uncharacterized protein LOC122070561 [Macadamia integrifolia]|uniref:uncharacterized protein LOC122070561 n=1 Tax=Macadamia integrifolia TaxID=60698 RepID=UPI001C4EB93B|nr:uncharacterized protein LOC122070561 [Macadamia integrifolia]